MSRKRYISTKISLDKRVNHLIRQGGYFAALLYTWMIPHAEDNARLTGDPEEILMTVLPGQQREKTPEDVSDALQIMHDLGLIVWDKETPFIEFPSFYTYQSYVKNEARSTPKNTADKQREIADNSGDQRKTPENAGKPRLVPVSFRSFSDPDPLSLPSPAPTRIHAPTREPDEAERESPLDDGKDDGAHLTATQQRTAMKAAFVEAWGMPDEGERQEWDDAIKQLVKNKHTADEVRAAIPIFLRRRPNSKHTPSVLAREIRALLSEARASPPPPSTTPAPRASNEPTEAERMASYARLLNAFSETSSE